MTIDLHKIPTFGVAGNFTGHLEQAGEARDFVNIKAETGAPKGVFPTFIPCSSEKVPAYLQVYPFDSKKIVFPGKDEKLQIECECVIACDLIWKNSKIIQIKPYAFAASNDCSIRKEGAKKISEKKNWGASSKGYSDNFIPLDSFSVQGNINNYRICSFLLRDNQLYEYGEDSFIKNYSYVYEKLNLWLIEKFNNQKDEGPLENLSLYLDECKQTNRIMVSIGATRYTNWGESNFLQNGDKSVVLLYPENKYSKEQIIQMINKEDFSKEDISFLVQDIII